MNEDQLPLQWDDEFKEALKMHALPEHYALKVHHEAGERYPRQEDKLPPPSHSALDVLSHDCVRVHMGVGGVCAIGYSCVAPILVRTQLEMLISATAITNADEPDLMAYRYMYSSFKQSINEEAYPKTERDRAKRTCRDGLKALPKELREEAERWVFQGKLSAYWYGMTPTAFLEEHLRYFAPAYGGLSAAAHGGYIGMRSFRDDPDELNLGPRPPRIAARRILFLSARCLLDLTFVRAQFLGLKAASDYPKLQKEIDSFGRKDGQSQVTDEDRRTIPTHQRRTGTGKVTKKKRGPSGALLRAPGLPSGR